jgi:ABC-type dipeptide/oligopeptide/nickel transport system permease component
MVEYTVRRAFYSIPVLFLVVIIIFSIVRMIPGDPAVALLGEGATQVQVQALRAQLKLDEPVVNQFFAYLGGLLQGDLGNSLRTGQPIRDELMQRLPATLELSLFALLISVLVGLPLGILSAVFPNSWSDQLTRIFALVGVSGPAFWFAIILQITFAIGLGILPVSGRLDPILRPETSSGFLILENLLTGNFEVARDAFLHVILPALVLAAFMGATIARFLRATMLEVLSADYIRTARGKGLTERTVLFLHALQNALLPVVTIVGLKFAELLGGAILTETVFAWPGMGRYMFDAIKNRDYPVIQGATLLFTVIYILSSLAVDLIYGLLDPRIRLRS